jgi:hypothetical protein
MWLAEGAATVFLVVGDGIPGGGWGHVPVISL